MTTGPRYVVDARPAAPPTFGLIDSADHPKDTDLNRWQNGIEYLPEGCVEGTTLDPCDIDTTMEPPVGPSIVQWDAYALTIEILCSTLSGRYDERIAEGERTLRMDSERQLGLEFADGALAQAEGYPNRYLSHPSVDDLTQSSAVGLVHGLACLDHYLATNNGGQQGMIHATGQAFVHWASFRMLRWVGNRVLSPLGNIVVVSPGYTGVGPYGPTVSANNVWAYATDMVNVRLSNDIQVNDLLQSVNRRQNDIIVTATRPALADWELCRHAGVKLALTPCDSGGS